MERSRRQARGAGAALLTFAVLDVVETVAVIGRYEDRITVVTHGAPDVYPAWLFYGLFEYGAGEVCRGLARRCADEVLILTGLRAVVLVLAVIAAVTWWRRMDRTSHRWLLAAAGLTAVSTVHRWLAAPPGPVVEGWLNTRPVGYPLWTVSAVVVVVAVLRARRAIRPAGGDDGPTGTTGRRGRPRPGRPGASVGSGS